MADLQRKLHIFNIVVKQFDMMISPQKTKCLVINEELKRFKLELFNGIIEQTMIFNYWKVGNHHKEQDEDIQNSEETHSNVCSR